MKNSFIDKLGEKDGSIYFHFVYQVLRVNNLWTEFKLLFSSGEKAIEILNNSAPSLFLTIRESMMRDIVTSVMRITEEEGTGRNRNLTLETLLSTFKDKVDIRLIENEKTKIYRNRILLKKHRDKIYSHNSFSFLVENKIEIEPFDKRLISELIESLNVCYKSTYLSLFNSSVILKRASRKDSMALLRKLERARRYENHYFSELEQMREFDSDFYVSELKFEKE
ncbi:MAG: hypothetical protein COA58_07570 [Bacteroidetes bacterium]|nr:MAG: hypothetical protein COA58_07570 [Bacteroidota bacterium]